MRVGGLFAHRTYVQFEGEALTEIDVIVTCQPQYPSEMPLDVDSQCRSYSATQIGLSELSESVMRDLRCSVNSGTRHQLMVGTA